MRREMGWALAAIAALVVGSICAEAYARLAVPYYSMVVRALASGHPWDIVALDVRQSESSPGSVLRLVADVRRLPSDAQPAARVVARVQVGEGIETPIVFWTMLLLWPAVSTRQRLVYLEVGVPTFLGLEAITTAAQLIHGLPAVSAILAGEIDPLTLWERWSRFLEGGGRFVVEVVGVLVNIGIAQWFARSFVNAADASLRHID